MTECDSCHKERLNITSAVVNGKYYRHICSFCLGDSVDDISGGAASFNRRRDYEDNAGDTIQPYDASGPNKEFLRLYPDAAKKVFSKKQIDELKRKI